MRHWTADTDREADALYRTFSYVKIRRYQDLAGQQMAMACRQRNQDAHADLQAMHDALARELRRRLDEGGDVGQRAERKARRAAS